MFEHEGHDADLSHEDECVDCHEIAHDLDAHRCITVTPQEDSK